jgi:hypothetical protein
LAKFNVAEALRVGDMIHTLADGAGWVSPLSALCGEDCGLRYVVDVDEREREVPSNRQHMPTAGNRAEEFQKRVISRAEDAGRAYDGDRDTIRVLQSCALRV